MTHIAPQADALRIHTPCLTGAALIARTLCELGVDTVFCYPGGANLEILDALSRTSIALVRTEHEQGAGFAAQGYARATGRLGVCLATSGPGATNLVTAIADAHSDSIPILALTGNVATAWLGRNAFQEVDIVSICRPITKLSEQVGAGADIAEALRRAADLACAGRPGPVLLDFPKDVQRGPSFAAAPSPAAAASRPAADLDPALPARLKQLLAASRRPVIYAGGGVIASGTGAALTRLAETLGCPVALTLMGLGAMDAMHPLCLGPLGMHGAWRANVAVNEADLVLALGVRFDDRVIGDPTKFAAQATIVHIDIDAAELGKNKPVALGIASDLRPGFAMLQDVAQALPTAPWLAYLRDADTSHPLRPLPASDGGLTGPQAIATLANCLPQGSIVTTGVGQHQMWTMQFLGPRQPRGLLTSGGFGTMGFGLPAAIGAKIACPDRMVVDVDGDGSLNMTINELATCRRHRVGTKVFVVNNQWLGMVRQWQDLIYAGNRVASRLDGLADDAARDAVAQHPDFATIAAGYRIEAARAATPDELEDGITRMLADPAEPFLLDVMVERAIDVLPMIPAGRSYRDVVFAPAG